MSKKSDWPREIRNGHALVRVYRMEHKTAASGWTYVIAWQTPTGRKREKFAKEADAIREAKTKAAQLADGRVEGASMSTGDRDELQAARKLAGDVPVLAALAEWAKVRGITGGHLVAAAEAWAARNGKAHRRITVADAAKAYLKAKTSAGQNVASDHSSVFNAIHDDLGTFHIDTISTRQLSAWLEKRENPISRNTYRKRIVALWRWAQRQGYLARDARTEAEQTERAHEPAPLIGIINVPTFRALLAYFREHHNDLLAPLVVAGFCGLRRAEVHAQTWEDISLERKNLRVTKGKRGTPARRMVPLCDAAVEWLMLCEDKTGPIGYALTIDRIRKLAREAMREDGTAVFPSLPENCFRHSYISHRVAATGDIPRVSLDAGNSPKEINRHYRELVTEEEGKLWFMSAPHAVAEIVQIRKAAN